MNQLLAAQQRLGISRAELARRLGLSPNAATKYALERQPIPRYVALACLALEHGLSQKCGEMMIEEKIEKCVNLYKKNGAYANDFLLYRFHDGTWRAAIGGNDTVMLGEIPGDLEADADTAHEAVNLLFEKISVAFSSPPQGR